MERWNRYRAPSQVIANIAEIERFQGNWEKSTRLKPALIVSLKKTSIVTSSGASTRIEGAVLTDQEVAELLDKGCKITSLSSRSEREVTGYIAALHYIYENLPFLELSEKVIRELHQLMTENLQEATLPAKQRGAYKDVPNDVVEIDEATGARKTWFKTTPPGVATEVAMRELIDEYAIATAEKVPELIKIGIFIVRFLAIHPFRDGNGRVSRLLTTMLLSQSFEWCQFVSHEKFIEDSKERYYVALRQCQSTFDTIPDYDPWLSYFTTTVAKQARYLAEQISRDVSAPSQETLSANERAVLEAIQNKGEATLADILAETDMSADGLRKLLKRLRNREIIELVGAGKASRYRAYR